MQQVRAGDQALVLPQGEAWLKVKLCVTPPQRVKAGGRDG